ncbi:MAG: acyl-CoA dehydrogenase [Candidatus Methylomirabilis sp.]|nr:acyl-CoA dehydrogenase [Deltaproteobacteria bacterium]
MDFSYNPQEQAFRQEVLDWLDANLPHDWGSAEYPIPRDKAAWEAACRDWWTRLSKGGWTGIAWPREFGGRGATPIEQAIYYETMASRAHPPLIGIIGTGMVGQTIMKFGTPEQKKRFLPPLLGGEEIWCQGFSEPNAGSDLAGVQTRAVLDGDHWVVTGQKVWTSFGQFADWCILVVRTDPTRPKHKGLSYLLVDMKSPGITVRPIVQINGEAEFNEMFFEGVRVPKDSILGEVNGGWGVAMYTLMHERINVGASLIGQTTRAINQLVAFAKGYEKNGRPASEDPLIRQKLAEYWAETEALKYILFRSLSLQAQGQDPGPQGSAIKLIWASLNQRLYATALDILGPAGQLEGGPGAYSDGKFVHAFLRARGNSIEGGTSEILRNIVAERVLGLPR